MKLGNNLKRCRFDKDGISQETLAQAIGISRQSIISIEKGRFIPSTLLALRFARYFESTVEDIFYLIEDSSET